MGGLYGKQKRWKAKSYYNWCNSGIMITVLFALIEGGEEDSASPTSTGQAKDVPIFSAETSDLTMSQKNALSKAGDYLAYSAFSYTGLIKQLKFEEFSTEDATYAADNCGADWNEQAALKAQQYLDYSSFSRSGLIAQLEFEGFTKNQAEYGANAVGY
jgi:hypothetical protein